MADTTTAAPIPSFADGEAPRVTVHRTGGFFSFCLLRLERPSAFGASRPVEGLPPSPLWDTTPALLGPSPKANVMPRQQTLQIEASQPFQQRGSQVGTQVSASPVDTYVDQGMNQRMSQLNSLLDSGHDLIKTIDEGEAAAGAKDAALGKEQSPSLMGRALGSYERGWMTVRGTVSGAEDASKILAEYQAGGFDPKNPQGLEGWLQQKC